jgi:oligopeptide/dipeptide ABC transporter ATP-binding protein
MEKILDIKNLRISFRTNNGTVKAVRGISLDLNKGETLAIVGESGSGKSVTARAIMGILAGNAIVESGEIFFNGRDLMKLPEEEFHQIRGNRISMIFQDPFSSLNPIMKIGKQLTEAMLLNGKLNQRDASREFSKIVHVLSASMTEALKKKGADDAASRVNREIGIVKKFTEKANSLEREYNTAKDWIESGISDIDGMLVEIINGEPKATANKIRDEIVRNAGKTYNDYLVRRDGNLQPKIDALNSALASYRAGGDKEVVKEALSGLRGVYCAAIEATKPDFFAMGYYVLYSGKSLEAESIEALNGTMRTFMNTSFMDAFLNDTEDAIRLSHEQALGKKQNIIDLIDQYLPRFADDLITPTECHRIARELAAAVEDSIDPLAIVKDSFAYTFRTSINGALASYLRIREIQGKKKLTRKDNELIGSGDLAMYRENVRTIMTRIRDAYAEQLVTRAQVDYRELAMNMVSFIKLEASKMVYRVTNRVAKKHAIDLMEEVGIPEARKRYYQYPFQFSGGMRQRIVIAIALSANPDILICDEPTTALDVTIQAQILDLINGLKKERQLSVIFITHDLGVVANMADQIAVMYAGKVVEYGTVDEVFYGPAHPYTWALLASMPDLDTKEKLGAIPGTPPNMIYPPKGDAFAVRNKYALAIDFEEEPPFFDITPTHRAATWLLHPGAPKAELPRIVSERIKRMRSMEVNVDE